MEMIPLPNLGVGPCVISSLSNSVASRAAPHSHSPSSNCSQWRMSHQHSTFPNRCIGMGPFKHEKMKTSRSLPSWVDNSISKQVCAPLSLRPPRCVSTGPVVVRLPRWHFNVNVNVSPLRCSNSALEGAYETF